MLVSMALHEKPTLLCSIMFQEDVDLIPRIVAVVSLGDLGCEVLQESMQDGLVSASIG